MKTGWGFLRELGSLLLSLLILFSSAPVALSSSDTTPPPPTSPLEPADRVSLTNPTPLFRWVKVVDPSGVTYTLEVDNDPDFSSPRLVKSGLQENCYQPVAPEEALDLGWWYWRVKVTDGAGNESDWSDAWSFFLDGFPPTFENLQPPDGAYLRENAPLLSAILRDPSGVRENSIKLYLDDNSVSPHYHPENGQVWYLPENSLAEGLHVVRLEASDNLGNSGSRSWSFTIDRTPPVRPLLLHPPDASVTNDNTPFFDWSDVVDPSGVTYTLEVSEDREFSSLRYVKGGLTGSCHEPETGLPDGTYYWRVRVRDGVGNENVSEIWRLTIDTTAPPAPSLLLPENNSILHESTPTFRWSRVGEARDYLFQLDNEPYFAPPRVYEASLTENSLSLPPENSLRDGVYYWRVASRDEVGNPAWSLPYSFRVDTHPPEEAPALLWPPDNFFLCTSTPTLRWSAVEDPSGVRYELQYARDNQFSVGLVIVENLEENRYTLPPLQDGRWYWRVRGVDGGGLPGPLSSPRSFVVDTRVEAPVLRRPENLSTVVNEYPVLFDWLDVEDEAGVVYTLEVDNDPDLSSPYWRENLTGSETYLSLPAGTWYWRVRVRDLTYDENGNLRGNENSSGIRRFDLLVDLYVERATLLWPPDGFCTRENTIYFDWSDVRDTFEPVEYELQMDDDTTLDPTQDDPLLIDTGWIASSCYQATDLLDGTYYWRVLTTDGAGNLNVSEVRSFTIDSRPPHSAAAPYYPSHYYAILVGVSKVLVEENLYARSSGGENWNNPENVENAPDSRYAKALVDNENRGYYVYGGNFPTRAGTIKSLSINVRYRVDRPFENRLFQLAYSLDGGQTFGPSSSSWIPQATSDMVVPVDVTGDRTWTWQDVGSLRVYLRSLPDPDNRDNASIYVDSLFLTCVYEAPVGSSPVDLVQSSLLDYPNWTSQRVTVLKDEGATVANLQQAINNLAASTTEVDSTDVFLFYFAGPGNSENLRLYDENLPGSRLREWLDNLRPRKIVILDSDGSGGLLRRFPSSYAVLASCRENESAGNYYFTSSLLQGLQATWYPHVGPSDNDNDFKISVQEAFEFARPLTENQRGGAQHPENNPGPLGIHLVGYWEPRVQAPVNVTLNDVTPTFYWTKCEDPRGVTYVLEIDDDNTFSSPFLRVENIQASEGPSSSFRYPSYQDDAYVNVPVVSYTLPPDRSLPHGEKTWYWRVKAVDGVGNEGKWSNTGSFRLDTVPPSEAPLLLQPENGAWVNDNTPTFQWTTVPGASGYELQLATDNSFTENLKIIYLYGNSYTPPEGAALWDNTWYWRVRARDSGGYTRYLNSLIFNIPPSEFLFETYGGILYNWGPWSQTFSFRIHTAIGRPSPLSPTRASLLDDSTPIFRWTTAESDLPVTYLLEVDNDPDFSSPIYSKAGIGENWHECENVLPDGTYHWRVRARDNLGTLSPWSESWSFTVDTSPPPPPELLQPENGGHTKENVFLFRWTIPPDPSSVLYDFQLDNDSYFSPPLLELRDLTENSLLLENALPEGTYHWRVRARDSWGHVGEWVSSVFTVDRTPPTGIPSLLSPLPGENTNNRNPTFRWLEVYDPSGVTYRLQISTRSDFSTLVYDKAGIAGTSHTAENALPDNVYYWRVRAWDAAGNEGPWSDRWSFRVDTGVAAPLLLRPSRGENLNDNTPLLSWENVQDLSRPVGFYVEVATDSLFENVVRGSGWIYENWWEVTPALPDNVYYWRVKVRDAVGNENWSENRRLVVDTVAPRSRIRTLPDLTNAHTFLITAENLSEDLSGVRKVELWYRYSDDNFSWGPWKPFGENLEPEGPWSWVFSCPEGDGFYQFYSLAHDWAGNAENKAEAEASCAVDTWVGAPLLLWPENRSAFPEGENRPRFDWSGLPEIFGVQYELVVSDDPSFSSSLLHAENLEDSEYPTPEENSFPPGIYYWKVRAVDGAGNENWSQVGWFRICTWSPLEGWSAYVTSPADWRETEGWVSGMELPARWEEAEGWIGRVEAPAVFVDNFNADFSQGTHENTENVDDALRLSQGFTSGRFTSRAFGGRWLRWENLLWEESEPTRQVQENDNVDEEENLSKSVILDNLEALREEDGRYENILENEENRLCVIHKFVGVPRGFDNYVILVKGYTSGENVGVYIYSSDNWILIGNLTENENTTISYVISSFDIENYLKGGENLLIQYEDFESDDTQDNLYLDLCILQMNRLDNSEVLIQVSTSSDNIYWGENLGPDGTPGTYFTSSPASLENIPENRYIRYIVYFRSENEGLSGENGPKVFEVVIYARPCVGEPLLSSPEDGSTIRDNTPLFQWTPAEDAVEYRILVDNDSDFSSPIYSKARIENYQHECENALPDGTYYWKVVAVGLENERESQVWCFTLSTRLGIPTPRLPENGSYLDDNTPRFEWENAENADWYQLQISSSPDFRSPIYDNSNVAENSCKIENALPEGRWYWRVRGRDNWNNLGEWSEVREFVVDVSPPAPLYLLSPSDGSFTNNSTPTFRWSGGYDANFLSYCLQVDNNNNFDDGVFYDNDNLFAGQWSTIKSYTLPQENALNLDGWWYWRVGARDRAGHVRWSEKWKLLLDRSPPSAPSNLFPEDCSFENSKRPTFRWSGVEDPSGVTYRLQISTSSTFSTLVYDKAGIAGTSHTLENDLPDNVYYWRVVVRDGAGNENASESFRFTVDTLAPPAPVLLFPENRSLENKKEVTFGWTEVVDNWAPGYENYLVQVARDQAFSSLYHENWVGDNSYSLTFAEDGVFWWRVRAADRAGNLGDWSESRRLTVDTTAPPAPQPLSPAQGENLRTTTPTFQWSPVADNTGVVYLLELDNDDDFSPPLKRWSTLYHTLSLSPENSLRDGVYYWRVVVRDGAGNENASESFRFTVDTWVASPLLLEPPVGGVLRNPVTLRWTSPEPSVAYTLKIDNDNDLSTPLYESTLSENLLSLSLPQGCWYWRVWVRDRAGNENSSSLGWFVVDEGVSPPLLFFPENNRYLRENRPFFDWQSLQDLTGVTYCLEIYLENGSLHFRKENLSFSEYGLQANEALPDNVYYWRVVVRDGAGNENASESFRFTVDTLAPPAPVLLFPENRSLENKKEVTFGWTEVVDNWAPGYENYLVQVARDQAFSSLYHENWVGDNSYSLTFAEDGVFWWRVRAADRAGNLGPWSESRRLTVDTTAPPAPQLLFPGAYTNENQLTFSWTKVLDLLSMPVTYRLQLAGENSFASPYYDNEPWIRLYAENSSGENFLSPENAKGAPDENFSLAILDNENRSYRLWGYGYRRREGEILFLRMGVRYRASGAFDNDNLVLTYSLDNGKTFGSRHAWRPSDNEVRELEVDITGDRVWTWEDVEKLRVYLLYENEGPADGENLYVDSLYLSCLSTSFTLPQVLGDGEYWWRVVVRDNAGHENLSPPAWFLVDTLPPAVPVPLSPLLFLRDDNTPLFDWQGVADPSGVTYWLQVDDENSFSPPLLENRRGLLPSQLELSRELPEGVYWWRVMAEDRAGNQSPWSENLRFVLDTLPPTPENLYLRFTLFEENENLRSERWASPSQVVYLNDNTPRIWLVLVDRGAGLLDYQLWLDNENTFTGALPLGIRSTTLENRGGAILRARLENLLPFQLPENLYYLRLVARDNIGEEAGGPHVQQLTWRFVVDVTPPENAPRWVEASWYATRRPTFRWSGVEDPSGVTYQLQISTRSDFSTLVYDKAGIAETSHTLENDLLDGVYYRRVRAVDNAGNPGPWSESVQFGIDTTPPSCSVNPLGTQTSSPFNVTVTASDALSGLVSVELFYSYSADNASWGENRSLGAKSSPPWSWSFNTPEGEGYYRFQAVARDNAGNQKTSPYTYALYQLPPPDFSLSVSPSSASVRQDNSTTITLTVSFLHGYSQTVELSAENVPSGVTVSFSPGSGNSDFSSTVTVSVSSSASPGTYSLTLKGTGGDGKTHTVTFTLTVTAAAPTTTPTFNLSLSLERGSLQRGSSTSLTVTVTALYGYNHRVSLSAAGQPSEVLVSFYPQSGLPSFASTMSLTVGENAPEGEHRITVRASGEDGTVKEAVYTLTVTSPPSPPAPPEEGGRGVSLPLIGAGAVGGLVALFILLKRLLLMREEWTL